MGLAIYRVVVAISLSFGFLHTRGQNVFPENWLANFLKDVNNLNDKIQGHVGQVNQQVREIVDSQVSLAQQAIRNSTLERAVNGNTGTDANKTNESSRGFTALGRSNGPLVILNGSNGASSRVVQSYASGDGGVNYVEQESRVVGGKLLRRERTYAIGNDGVASGCRERRYELNLTDTHQPPPIPTDQPC